MSDLDYIKMEAIALDVGETTTVQCCFCNSDEKKLSITRKENGIVYNCWRAACSGRGFIGCGGWVDNYTEKAKTKFVPKIYLNPTMELSVATLKLLSKKYGLDAKTLSTHNVSENWDGDTLVMPLYSRYGSKFGVTIKRWGGSRKAVHYIERKEPMLHYTLTNKQSPPVVLVEDVLSAMRITQLNMGWVGVALLGTDVNDEKTRSLKLYGSKDIIIALDPDALQKAWKIQKKFGLFFKSFTVATMSNDPKDLTDQDLIDDLGI